MSVPIWVDTLGLQQVPGNSKMHLKILLHVKQQTSGSGVWSFAKLGCWLSFTQEGVLEINNEQRDASQHQLEGFSHSFLPSALFLWAVTPSQVRCSLQIYVGFSGSPILIFPIHFAGSLLFRADFPWKYQALFCYSAEVTPFPPYLSLPPGTSLPNWTEGELLEYCS